MEIPLPTNENSDIFSYGFDQGLNRGGAIESPIVYDTNNAVQSVLLGSGAIIGDLTLASGQIKSSNYTDSTGWNLDSDGNLYANNGVFRGDITGATGVFSNLSIVDSFTAQENITVGEAVCIGDGTSYVQQDKSYAGQTESVKNSRWLSQVFTTSAVAISIEKIIIGILSHATGLPISVNGAGITVHLYAASGGKPTGSSLGNVALSGTGGANGDYVVTFSTPIAVSLSTNYCIVIQVTGEIGDTFDGTHAAVGATRYQISTDSGSTWGNGTADFVLRYMIYEIDTVSGQISRTQTNISRARSNNFIGFAKETKSAGQSCKTYLTSLADGLVGLTTGVLYYLSDTLGAISTSAGTVSRKIGISISTSRILIKHDNN